MRSAANGLMFVLVVAILGCSGGESASEGSMEGNSEGRTEQSILGVYENSVDGVGVELKADGKATLIVDGDRFETTWERDGADRIIVYGEEGMRIAYNFNSDGNLSDDMGYGSVLRKQ
jgi:hypothetical protein